MTFFYNLNDKLNAIREKPETTHKQLNERDMGKHNNKTTGFKAVADKAAKEYGSKAAGERVAGAQFQKMKKAGKLEEQDMEEGMSRAAKGYEKYGKQGMEALAKAGREGKALDPVRNRYDKYDEGMGDVVKKVGSAVKKVGGAVLNRLSHGSDEDMRKDLQRKMGVPQTGKKPEQVKEKMSPAKSQSFAALAPPKDKITFADKIAGAKKEVDEMLGDVAAEAIKSALTPKQQKLDKNNNGKLDANDFAMLRKGGKKQVADEGWDEMEKDVKNRMSARKVGDVTHGAKHDTQEIPGGRRVTRRTDPNTGYSVGADSDTPAAGEKRGRGRPKSAPKGPERVTANATKHKGGRKTNEGEVSTGNLQQMARLVSGLKMFIKDPDGVAILKELSGLVKHYAEQGGEQELDEKAVSKKQQKFMGMVHATQKGEKAPSKAVAKVAKTMKKSDAEDFASTKHKGLPEKKKPEGKKKEKTEEAGGTGTPTASSGFGFGQGIYDSMNHELETMIRESMNVSMSMNTDATGGPSQSVTVTATDDDAVKLGELLKNAGLGGDYEMGGETPGAEVEIHGAEGIADQIRQAIDGDHGHEDGEVCDACGQEDCGCEEVDEAYGDDAVSQNSPDYPTNTETAQDSFEYSGGLNGPKSTGQTTIPVIAGQDERMGADDLRRLREMAGIREAAKPDFLDMDKDGNKTEPFKKAVDDKKAAGNKKVAEGLMAELQRFKKV